MKIEKFFCFMLILLSVQNTKRYNKKRLIRHFGRKLTADIDAILKQFNYFNEAEKQKEVLYHYYMSSFLSIQKSFFINIGQYSKTFWSKFAQMAHLTKPGSMVFHLRTFLKIISKQKIRNMKTLTLMISKYADNLKLSGMLSGSEKSYFVHSMLQILKKYQLVNKGANRFNFVMQRYQEEACEEVIQFLDSQSLFRVSKQVINDNNLNLHKILSKYIDYSYYKLPYQKMAKLYLKNNYKAQGIGMKKLDGVIAKTRDYYIKKKATKMHANYQSQTINRLFVRFFRKSAGDMVLSKEKTVPIQRVIGDQLAQSFSRIFNEQKFFSVQQVHKTYEKYTQFFNGLFMKMPPLKLKAINEYVKKNIIVSKKGSRDKILYRNKDMLVVKIRPHLKAKNIFKFLSSRHFKKDQKQEFTKVINRMKQYILVKNVIHHTTKALLYNTKNFSSSKNQNLQKQVSRIKETLLEMKKIDIKSKSVQKLTMNYFKLGHQKFNKIVTRLKELPLQKIRTHLVAKTVAKTLNKKFLSLNQLKKLQKSVYRQKELVLQTFYNRTIQASYKGQNINQKNLSRNQLKHYLRNIKRYKEFNTRKNKINLLSNFISKLNKHIRDYQNVKSTKNMSVIKEFFLQIPKKSIKGIASEKIFQKEKLSINQLKKYLKSINRKKENIIKAVGPIHYRTTNISNFRSGLNILFNLKSKYSQSLSREKNMDMKAIKAHLIGQCILKIKQQLQQSLNYKSTRSASRIKELLKSIQKKAVKTKAIHELIQQQNFSVKQLQETVKSLERQKIYEIRKIGRIHFKTIYDSKIKKQTQLQKRLATYLNLERSKEIDFLQGLSKIIFKAKAELDQKNQISASQNQELRKSLSAFKDFYIQKKKQPIKAKYIDDILKQEQITGNQLQEVLKSVNRIQEYLMKKVTPKRYAVTYDNRIIRKKIFQQGLNNRLNLERSREIDFLTGISKGILKAKAALNQQNQITISQNQELRKSLSAFKDFYIEKKKQPIKAKYVQNILKQEQITGDQLHEILKSINRIKEHLIKKVTPKKYAVTLDNRIVRKSSFEYQFLNRIELQRVKEHYLQFKLLKNILKAVNKQKQNISLEQNQKELNIKSIDALKEFYISKKITSSKAKYLIKFLNENKINSQNLLQIEENLQRYKDILQQQLGNKRQFISLKNTNLGKLALKAVLKSGLEMNRYKETNIARSNMKKLDKLTYKLDEKLELSLQQNKDIKNVLTAYRDYHIQKYKQKSNIASKFNINIKLQFFNKHDFSYLNRMKDFHIANPKFTKKFMTLYAKTFNNFYYNNYKDFKGVFSRFVDIWKNHKVIQKSESYYLKKNIPLQKFFFENFYHVGNLLKHYKHKLIIDTNSQKLLYDNKLFGISEKKMQKIQNSIYKLRLKYNNTNDLTSLISLNAVRTAMENFTVNENFKTLKKFKYVFVDKLPDHHELKFKGKLTKTSSKSERFVQNLFSSKVKYKEALYGQNMMNFNLDSMPLTNSNIQIAKNVFKTALFYPQLNPFRDYLKHSKTQSKNGNLTVKELQQVGFSILKKLKNKTAANWKKTELKFLNIVKKNSLSQKELKKIFSGNMLNKKLSLKGNKYQKGTILAFKTLVDIARFRKIHKYNNLNRMDKVKLKKTELNSENTLIHDQQSTKQTRSQNKEIYSQIFKKVYNKRVKKLPYQEKKIFKRFVKNFSHRLNRISSVDLKKILLNFAAKQFQNKINFYNMINAPFTSKNIKFNFNDLLSKFLNKHKGKNNQQSFLQQVKKQYGLKAFKRVQNLSQDISKQELKQTINFLNQLIIGSIKEQNQFKKDMIQSLNQFEKVIFTPNIIPPSKRQSFTDSEFQFYDSILKQKEIQKIKQQNDFGKRTIANQQPEKQELKKKPPLVLVCCMCGCFTNQSSCCDDEYDNKNLYFLNEADSMININPKIFINLFLQDKNGKVKKQQSIEIHSLQKKLQQQQNALSQNTKNINKQLIQEQIQETNDSQDTRDEVEINNNTDAQQNIDNNQSNTLKNQEPQNNYSITQKIIQKNENHQKNTQSVIQYQNTVQNKLQPTTKTIAQPSNEILEIDEQELDNKYKQKINQYHELHIDNLDNIYKIEHMKEIFKKYSENYKKSNRKISNHFQDYNINFEDDNSLNNESELVNEFKQKSRNVNKQNFHINNDSMASLETNPTDVSDIYNTNLLGDISQILKKQQKVHKQVFNNEYKLENLSNSVDDYYDILETKKKLIQFKKFYYQKQTNYKHGLQRFSFKFAKIIIIM